MKPPPILSVEDLSVWYPKAESPAVSHLTFDLEAGKWVSLVGSSGCGKSTALFSMLRLLEGVKMEGRVVWRGGGDPIQLHHAPLSVINRVRGRHIAMIFQDPSRSLNPAMRVVRQVTEAYRHHTGVDASEAVAAAHDLLGSLQVDDPARILRSFPHQLSGGLKQRVAIAAAFLSKPRLVLADEPTSSLDALTAFETMKFLKRFQQSQGTSILFVTHDMRLAERFSDEIWVMQKGRLEDLHGEFGRRLLAASCVGAAPKSYLKV